jgi:hypothetical protein
MKMMKLIAENAKEKPEMPRQPEPENVTGADAEANRDEAPPAH